MLIVDSQQRVPRNRGGSRAVQHPPERGAPAANRAPATHRPAVMVKRRHSDQGRGLLAVKGAELRQPSQQRSAQHRPHPRHAVQQFVLLAPQLGAAHRAVDVTVQMLEPLAQIVDMAADLALQSPGRVFEPVFLSDDHLQQVVAPRAQRAQLAGLLVGQRPHLELGPLRIQRQEPRVDAVGLG